MSPRDNSMTTSVTLHSNFLLLRIFPYTGAIDETKELESQISDLVEELANERIELDRYKTLLENEKGKVLELQQLHKAEDKSELEQLVENTR